MSETEDTRAFYRKWYGRFLVLTALMVIVTIASVGASVVMFINYNNIIDSQQELIDRYDNTLNTMTEYDIRVDLNVTWLDYSISGITVPRNGNPKPSYDNNLTITHWKYIFETTDLVINTSENPFRWIYMTISVPIRAYDVFKGINCQWSIAGQTGLFTKQEFNSVNYSAYYYVADLDISTFMWKEIVPQVQMDITLAI